MSDRPELESSVVASTPEPEPPPQSEPDPATDVEGEPAADRESAADDAEAPVGVAAGPEAGREQGSWIDDAVAAIDDVVAWFRANSASVCLALVLAGIAIFTIVFGTLAVRNHRNFGTWAYDGAIYDQAIWLVSRFDQTFMTVRGMDVWGHHLNLVFFLFAPFYRLGAGPEFLYVVQNFTIALAALPVYLIAKERFNRPSVGLVFAFAYLMYAPIQWISWINFHPEALCIAPFMFAWWFALKQRWTWYFVSVACVLIMREDAALAVIMLGFVLVVINWRGVHRQVAVQMGAITFVLGVVWYAVATQLVIPHFNDGSQAFYLEYFYSEWGGSISGIAENVIRHPDRVINVAMKPDRMDFYYKLGLPLGGFAILSPITLLMAGPQMLASVIGGQPYARQILYQYPSIMIAPIVIASIEGARFLWLRWRFMRWGIYVWLGLAAYISNVAWSNSPIANGYGVWAQNNPRREALQGAVDLVPTDAVVSSSYNIGSHLSHREHSYDWPNPFWPAYWGNDDCVRFPSASVVEYLVMDMNLFGPDDPNRAFVGALIDAEQFELVYDEENVWVLERLTPGPGGEAVPVNCPVDAVTGQQRALEYIGADTVPTTIPTFPTLPGEEPAAPPTTEPRPLGFANTTMVPTTSPVG